MNSDASLKLDDEPIRVRVGIGIVAINKDWMPIGWQLQWFDITCNTLLSGHILMSDAFAMLKNVYLAKAKGYPMVSFQTDSLSVKKVLTYQYRKGKPRDVNFYLDQARTIIDVEGWSYDFVH